MIHSNENKTTDFELDFISSNQDHKLDQPEKPITEKWSFIMGIVMGIVVAFGVWLWWCLIKIIF